MAAILRTIIFMFKQPISVPRRRFCLVGYKRLIRICWTLNMKCDDVKSLRWNTLSKNLFGWNIEKGEIYYNVACQQYPTLHAAGQKVYTSRKVDSQMCMSQATTTVQFLFSKHLYHEDLPELWLHALPTISVLHICSAPAVLEWYQIAYLLFNLVFIFSS